MAKKDTYLALLRRGIDETTAMQLADAESAVGSKDRQAQIVRIMDETRYC